MIRANSSVHAWTTIKDKKLCNLQTGKQMNDIYVNRALPCSKGVIDLELLCLYWKENNDVKLFFKHVVISLVKSTGTFRFASLCGVQCHPEELGFLLNSKATATMIAI